MFRPYLELSLLQDVTISFHLYCVRLWEGFAPIFFGTPLWVM